MSSSLRLAVVSLVLVVLMAAAARAYNDDRPVYKWSPLWFNSYLRRGVLHKRFNDDSPIYKWSPMWLDREGMYRQHYKRLGACLPEWTACSPDGKPCCSGACFEGACIGNGEYFDGEYDR